MEERDMTAEPKVVTCPHCGRRNRVQSAAVGTPRCGTCRKPLPWVVDADDADFAEVADKATIPVLVDLWAPWCGPCRKVSPMLEELAAEMAGEFKLVKVNADTAPSTSQRLEALAIPTMVLLRDGEVVARQVGAVPPTVLRPWLEDALAKQRAS